MRRALEKDTDIARLLISGGTVVTLGKTNRVIPDGAVLIEDGLISVVGKAAQVRSAARDSGRGRGGTQGRVQELSAEGQLILPGFICAHHHLYSTFARGMSVPGAPAKNFPEILEKLWWKLDRTLTREDIYWSAMTPLLECIRHGTTTVIDHHESQSAQVGSLDEIERAVAELGMRVCLCLGLSDRDGRGAEGLREADRFLREGALRRDGLVSVAAGLHASFTVEDDTLDGAVDLMHRYRAGLHVHCAEDVSDQAQSRKRYGLSALSRLARHGALTSRTLVAHGIHLDEEDLDQVAAADAMIVHNPESNMNNAVGCADVLGMLKRNIVVGLGTDGMASHMPSQMRAAYLLQRHQRKDPRVGFGEAVRMLLAENPVIAGRFFDERFGELSRGAAGDVILVRYAPPTPLDETNFGGHLAFGLVHAVVTATVVAGRVLMAEGRIRGVDEDEIAARSREQARKFWRRFHGG